MSGYWIALWAGAAVLGGMVGLFALAYGLARLVLYLGEQLAGAED